MRICALVLAFWALASQGRRGHFTSERVQGSSSPADVRKPQSQRQLRVSTGLSALATLLVTSDDLSAAYQLVGTAKSPAAHQMPFQRRAPLSTLVGQVQAPAKEGALVLSNPMYLKPKAGGSKRPSAQGLRGPPPGQGLRGPPPGAQGFRERPLPPGQGLRGPPGQGLRGPPGQGLRGPPLRGPPGQGAPLRGQPPMRGQPPPKGKRAKGKDDIGILDDDREQIERPARFDEQGGPQTEWNSRKRGKKKKKGRGGDDDDEPMGRYRDDDMEDFRGKRKKKGKQSQFEEEDLGPPEVLIEDSISVGELASQLRIGAGEVIKTLMTMGTLASVTQAIDSETAEKIAEMYGGVVIRDDRGSAEVAATGIVEEEDDADALITRPPVVTIMGHVDHGKTSLLDAMRMANVNVVDGEAGGITQHIGAYSVKRPDSDEVITFIDTPGHAAFNEMRSRGANITDIVVLAVAANDGLMPQTMQSIKAARAADVPIVVALTKTDLPQADPDKVKQQLLEREVVLEKFGGDVLHAEVSAKTGAGLDDLFEQIGMQAEVLDLKANPNRLASGAVLEARQERGSGAIATVLVQRGTMNVGDIVVCGAQWGKVRAMTNEQGDRQESAGPSAAVELQGLDGVPDAGDQLTGVEDENGARALAATRQKLKQQATASASFKAKTQSEMQLAFKGSDLPIKVLDFVIKADVQGSAEALASALEEIEDADDKLRVQVRVLRARAGEVTGEDIKMASVSKATIIGFGVPISQQVRNEAAENGIPIKEFKIVYDAMDDVNAQIASLLRPPPSKQLGNLCGKLNVKQLFKVAALGKIAGCEVVDGYIKVGNNIRILRGNIITYEGRLKTLRSFKDEVDQVDEGNDCGISFDDYQGMESGDRVEAYTTPDQEAEADDDDY